MSMSSLLCRLVLCLQCVSLTMGLSDPVTLNPSDELLEEIIQTVESLCSEWLELPFTTGRK